jgi:hypothetical protein
VLWDMHTGGQIQTLRRDRPYERMDIAGLTGIADAQRAARIAWVRWSSALNNCVYTSFVHAPHMPSIPSQNPPLRCRIIVRHIALSGSPGGIPATLVAIFLLWNTRQC